MKLTYLKPSMQVYAIELPENLLLPASGAWHTGESYSRYSPWDDWENPWDDELLPQSNNGIWTDDFGL
jgi:hypothetical protein